MGIFYDKVADRIGKLDAEALRRQYKALTDEIGFFESIFNSLDEGIVALDADGKVKYANEAGRELIPLLGIGEGDVGDAAGTDGEGVQGISVKDAMISRGLRHPERWHLTRIAVDVVGFKGLV